MVIIKIFLILINKIFLPLVREKIKEENKINIKRKQISFVSIFKPKNRKLLNTQIVAYPVIKLDADWVCFR